MSRIKELALVVEKSSVCLLEAIAKQTTIGVDLYDSIKEVAELKYRMLELEVKVNNLTDYIKTQNNKGVK